MFVSNVATNLGEVVPVVPAGVLSEFQIFVEVGLVDFRVGTEVRLHIGDPFVADVPFLQIIQNVRMMLVVEAEEHFRVVNVAMVPHQFWHRVQQPLVQFNLMHL